MQSAARFSDTVVRQYSIQTEFRQSTGWLDFEALAQRDFEVAFSILVNYPVAVSW
jgi:hypothetical protein